MERLGRGVGVCGAEWALPVHVRAAVSLAGLVVGRPMAASVGVLGTTSLSGGLGPVSCLSRKMLALHKALLQENSRAAGQGQPPPQQTMVVSRDNTNAEGAKKAVRLQEAWPIDTSKLPAKAVRGLLVLAADSLFHALAMLLPRAPGPVEAALLTPGAEQHGLSEWATKAISVVTSAYGRS